jgi:hypothetical protein
MLEKEIMSFDENLQNWLTCHAGQFVLIKGDDIDFFNTYETALTEAARRYGLDSYLVRLIAPKQEEIVIPALTLGLLRANIPHSNRP